MEGVGRGGRGSADGVVGIPGKALPGKNSITVGLDYAIEGEVAGLSLGADLGV